MLTMQLQASGNVQDGRTAAVKASRPPSTSQNRSLRVLGLRLMKANATQRGAAPSEIRIVGIESYLSSIKFCPGLLLLLLGLGRCFLWPWSLCCFCQRWAQQ